MKTTALLFTTAFILAAPFARAQETAPPPPPEPVYGSNVSKIRFGAYLAPTISWMRPTASKSDDGNFSVSSNGSKVGFMYGLMAEYFFAPNYGLVTGLQINSTGGKMNATNITPAAATMANQVLKADFDYQLQYLEIPLALKLKTDNINRFKFFGQLGITAGINIGKKASYTVSYTDASGAVKPDATGDKIKITGDLGAIAPVLFEMNIGAGAEYPLSNKLTAYFGLFFNNGFAPDATAPQKYDSDKLGYGKASFKDGNTRLNNFALRLGLFF